MTVIEGVWDDFRLEPQELIDAGDHVVAGVKVSGKPSKPPGCGSEASVAEIPAES